MKTITLKSLAPSLKRGVKIYALLCVVATILSFSASEVLIDNAFACTSNSECRGGDVCVAGICAPPTPAPEIPLAMIPLFLLMSAGGVYAIRRRSMLAHA